MKKKILISTGGSGGHVLPAIAIYDHLKQAELGIFLAQDKMSYDLIVAADVLPYVGQLDELFEQIAAHLEPEGYFMFTTEINDTKSWVLESSARFSHQPAYIQRLIETNHLVLLSQEKIPARLQNQIPLEVMLYVAQLKQ